MRWFLVLTLVIGLFAQAPNVTRADVGVALRRVPVQVTLTVDLDYPEFAFFLVDSERHTVQRVSPTVTDPAVANFGPAGGSYFLSEIYVVPKAELATFDGGLPPAQWFGERQSSKYRAGLIHVRPFLDVFDNRDRIENTYLVQQMGDHFRVDLLSENQGDPWVQGAWVGICCVVPGLALSVAVALTGLWLVRRSRRRSRT